SAALARRPSRSCRPRPALRRNTDCARRGAAASHCGIRRKPLRAAIFATRLTRTRTVPMSLNVAVQMDPIANINVDGDSTFARLLEAKKRGPRLSYYTPDRLSLLGGDLFAPVQPLDVRDQIGDHFTLGKPEQTNLKSFD